MKLVDLRPKKIGADMRGVCQLGALLNQNEPPENALKFEGTEEYIFFEGDETEQYITFETIE